MGHKDKRIITKIEKEAGYENTHLSINNNRLASQLL